MEESHQGSMDVSPSQPDHPGCRRQDLIDLFLKGLAREATKTQTWAFLPRGLTAAAQRAQNIEADANIFGILSDTSSSINALQGNSR